MDDVGYGHDAGYGHGLGPGREPRRRHRRHGAAARSQRAHLCGRPPRHDGQRHRSPAARVGIRAHRHHHPRRARPDRPRRRARLCRRAARRRRCDGRRADGWHPSQTQLPGGLQLRQPGDAVQRHPWGARAEGAAAAVSGLLLRLPRLAPQRLRKEALLTGPLAPINKPNAMAKIAGIKLCERFNRQYGRESRTGIPQNLYGPGDKFHPDNSHVILAHPRRFHEAARAGEVKVTI